MKTQLRLCADTHPGRVRQNNEDNLLINADLTTNNWDQPTGGQVPLGDLGALLVVADGMGGASAGEVASGIAVTTIREEFTANALGFTANPEQSLKRLLIAVNAYIVRAGEQGQGAKGMGTTCVIVWVINDHAHVAWVGDSRAYLYNPHTGLRQISKDHSFVQELVDAGKLTMDQAFYHPESHIITQSLGDSGRTPKPDYNVEKIYNGDQILVCSDGLNGMLLDREIEAVFRSSTDILSTQKQLIQAANNAGGSDNITVVIGEFANDQVRPVPRPVQAEAPVRTSPVAQYAAGGYIASREPAAAIVPESGKKDRQTRLLLIAGILVALGAIAYMLWSEQSQQAVKAEEAHKRKLDSLENVRAAAEAQRKERIRRDSIAHDSTMRALQNQANDLGGDPPISAYRPHTSTTNPQVTKPKPSEHPAEPQQEAINPAPVEKILREGENGAAKPAQSAPTTPRPTKKHDNKTTPIQLPQSVPPIGGGGGNR